MVPLGTILLIEDNPADVILVGEALKAHGVDRPIRVLPDGAAALAFIGLCSTGKQAPALVILDLNLPKHDGFEVLATIRGEQVLAQTPVIVISSSRNPADQRAVLALGATCYFTKHSDLDDFLQLGKVVGELLAVARLSRSGAAC